ncbi:MAG: hypothetical protein V4717_06190 [Bacteroidota bacterium]
MKNLYCLIIFQFVALFSQAQDVFTRGLVYQVPAMKRTIIKQHLVYRNIGDTALEFDIYYPPSFAPGKKLPVVIFNNGAGGMEIPKWAIYKDWAKLVAANGMIGINHQTRNQHALQDGEALLDYLLKNAGTLQIDTARIGMWTCSANARTGMRIAYKSKPKNVHALVVYYGGPDSLGQLRQDLPTLMVRAGLDAQFLNTGIDNFIQASLQQDTRIELINYLEGIHAFDAFTNTKESREIIIRTIEFLKKNLLAPVTNHDFVLTNKNFMWLIMNNQLPAAIDAFKNARTKYRSDSNFQPFYNAVIREDVLNANAYWLLSHQRENDAVEVFKLGAETYPESPNALESLSEAYERVGNNAAAIQYAKACLERLPAANNLNENFKRVLSQSTSERIQRLSVNSNDSVTGIPAKRAHHDLVYDEANKVVLLTGGSTPLNGGSSFSFYNDVWHFNGRLWKKTGNAGDQRSGMRLCFNSKTGTVFSFGGFSKNNTTLADLRVLENGSWRILSNDSSMKAAEPGFVYDKKADRLIVFGGSVSRGQVINTTWTWRSNSWTKMVGEGPGGRQAFAMIYDEKRNKTIVYGGMDANGKAYADTWELDNDSWKKVANDGPGARTSPGYAYDSKRGLFVIFGGTLNGRVMNDTWGWDGTTWRKLAENGPPSRTMGYMAYDKHRDRTVLFGGRLGWPNDTNDTWEWNGSQWSEVK